MGPRRVKNSSGFALGTDKHGKDEIFSDIWYNRLKRWFICWIIGHNEVGVYSWISYCQRCALSFDPTDSDYWDENEDEDE